LRNAKGQTAILVKRGRGYAQIVPMKSGALAVRRIGLAALEKEWKAQTDYDSRAAVARFLAHGEQRGMTAGAEVALRAMFESLEGQLRF
jgi:antitoxin (DNA-binding transcriptional repressor) of toxin-antitoxin stability system